MKICANCGTQVPDDAVFCNNCGSALTENAAPQAPANGSNAANPTPAPAPAPVPTPVPGPAPQQNFQNGNFQQQGFQPEQTDEQIRKFFIAYTRLWQIETERSLELLQFQYLTDVHAAAHVRINGMMRLQDDWYRLYDVQPTDKLYLAPEDRMKIW